MTPPPPNNLEECERSEKYSSDSIYRYIFTIFFLFDKLIISCFKQLGSLELLSGISQKIGRFLNSQYINIECNNVIVSFLNLVHMNPSLKNTLSNEKLKELINKRPSPILI